MRLPANFRRNLTLLMAVILTAAATAQLGGCYRRVVGAKGLGASNMEVNGPYQENSKLDDWIFGERQTKTSPGF